ncbi:MAG: 50S ribosome-binding GTPase [Planctomycetes bacterium]|nr:50S ribosome-binding GTPase [Planctomycetota bacterium]
MPANLTPQYLEAEAEFKRAQTAEERLAALKKMWALLPKHKGTDKLQAELKAKLSEARDEAEQEKRSPKKGGISYKIPKQGAGQYVLLGAPNAGKSLLVSRLTRATPEVAAYPFTTREPVPGMMEWQDVQVELIDTPPITADFMEGYLSSLVRAADAVLLVVDLGDEDGPFAAEAVLDRLAQVKTILGGAPKPDEPHGVEHVRTLLVANKIDLPGAADRLEVVRDLFGQRFPVHVVSAETRQGLEDLRDEIYKFLDVIRVYTKKPGKPADLAAPFTIRRGGTLMDLASRIHRELPEKLKSARVWGTGVFDGQTVPRDHILHDRDVVEIHA